MTNHSRRGLTAGEFSTVPAPSGRFAQPDRRPRRDSSLTRRIEVAFLLDDGTSRVSQHAVPDHPVFLETAGALARGTVVRTSQGPVAVEDLLPGDELPCKGGRTAEILWIGSTLIAPTTSGGVSSLTRVMPDAFGFGRPQTDVLLGPGARLLHAQPGLASLTGAAEVLTPLHDFLDGETAVAVTPPTPVRTYHLVLARHAAFEAGGLMIESFHPGLRAAETLGPTLRPLFLSLFPHLSDLAEFGALGWPRVSGETLARLTAA
ncbi:MAG: Hint domain-containing protein [Rhodobacteraceae bacterium HLUCCA24]|nr:MAG: Hint domain-containing protein [Rhodobacteraceae bacterium HLUCCA24]